MIPPIAPIGKPMIAPGIDPPVAKYTATEVPMASIAIKTRSRVVNFKGGSSHVDFVLIVNRIVDNHFIPANGLSSVGAAGAGSGGSRVSTFA
jgi:hypothetical protein